MARATIELQKRGFSISPPNKRKHPDWDALIDAFFELPNVESVDGPQINGSIGVTYDSDDRPDAVLIAELQAVCDRFMH